MQVITRHKYVETTHVSCNNNKTPTVTNREHPQVLLLLAHMVFYH